MRKVLRGYAKGKDGSVRRGGYGRYRTAATAQTPGAWAKFGTVKRLCLDGLERAFLRTIL